MAAQLTVTKGALARRLLKWIAWATSSLPVPLSPVTSTGASVSATCSMRRSTSSHCGESPLIRKGRPVPRWLAR